ncbi:MAG: hypothetical protein ACJAWL_000191 [Motiliproteus sp.]|jgi:hypothetical protein
MLTYEDCCDFYELSRGGVGAVAEHEHLPRIQALGRAVYLVRSEGGERMIRRMIIDDIRYARATQNFQHEEELKQVLLYFIQTHPNHACKAKGSQTELDGLEIEEA